MLTSVWFANYFFYNIINNENNNGKSWPTKFERCWLITLPPLGISTVNPSNPPRANVNATAVIQRTKYFTKWSRWSGYKKIGFFFVLSLSSRIRLFLKWAFHFLFDPTTHRVAYYTERQMCNELDMDFLTILKIFAIFRA